MQYVKVAVAKMEPGKSENASVNHKGRLGLRLPYLILRWPCYHKWNPKQMWLNTQRGMHMENDSKN
jgi:hypothetical protein